MKLEFIATGIGPDAHEISGETINGIDLSPLDFGGLFVGNEDTRAAGIRDAHRDAEGELRVTLTERTMASRLPGRKAHWRGTGQEIDAADYDPAECHVTPTGLTGLTEGTDYRIVWRDGMAPGESGWTVESVEQEEPTDA